MNYDVIIIGSGPAGYVAAIRSSQIGLKTALIEKKQIGGMCVNWGCIPIKSLIESGKLYQKIKHADNFGIEGIDNKKLTVNWDKAKNRAYKLSNKLNKGIHALLKKNAVDIIEGEAKITSKNSISVNNRSINAGCIIISTGSKPGKIQFLPEELVTEISNIKNIEKVPNNIAVYGYGPIAIEIAQLFKSMDKNVTLISPQEKLIPKADKFLENFVIDKFRREKIKIVYHKEADKKIKPSNKNEFKINDHSFKADLIINCSWRDAVLPESKLDFELENGYLKVNNYLQTNIDNIYAVGDVNGMSYFAHTASAQGMHAVNHIKGVKKEFLTKNFPINIYSSPEMAQIGMTEEEITKKGIAFKETVLPLSANGKALTEGNTEGSLRILSEEHFGEVLGVQIIANNATDLISEAAAFISVEATVYDVAKTVHAHPTISEVFMEAGFEAIDQSMKSK
jgi:dihydrolipoamide dehydrogenase